MTIGCTEKVAHLGYFLGTRSRWLIDTFNRTQAGIGAWFLAAAPHNDGDEQMLLHHDGH